MLARFMGRRVSFTQPLVPGVSCTALAAVAGAATAAATAPAAAAAAHGIIWCTVTAKGFDVLSH